MNDDSERDESGREKFYESMADLSVRATLGLVTELMVRIGIDDARPGELLSRLLTVSTASRYATRRAFIAAVSMPTMKARP